MNDAENARIMEAIKHFESLQKRYATQHNGTACEHVKLALEGLHRMFEPKIIWCNECRFEPDCKRSIAPGGVWEQRVDFCSYGECMEVRRGE